MTAPATAALGYSQHEKIVAALLLETGPVAGPALRRTAGGCAYGAWSVTMPFALLS
jgi:hypothetical protein